MFSDIIMKNLRGIPAYKQFFNSVLFLGYIFHSEHYVRQTHNPLNKEQLGGGEVYCM